MSNDSFGLLGIEEPFCRALAARDITDPTPIQHQAIPPLLEGRDLIGLAQTGTGKTAAFGLPMLQRLNARRGKPVPRRPRALVLAPTRELATQIHESLTGFAEHVRLSSTVIFGGVGPTPQIQAMRKGVDVLVATPGRLLDLMGQQHIELCEVLMLVLDEADRLLDMGFIRDVRRIVQATPEQRQTLLFSATMPAAVAELAAEVLDEPLRVDVSPRQVTVRDIEQRVFHMEKADKRAYLTDLLKRPEVRRAIVFTRTKHGADRVARHLDKAGIGARAIHGGKGQGARQKALAALADGEAWVLVATDIAARGIHIDGITHVINFELPNEPESYVHRIGRTGRAGAAGVAWSLAEPTEHGYLRDIEKLIGFRIQADGEPPMEPEQPTRGTGEGAPPKKRRRRRRRPPA